MKVEFSSLAVRDLRDIADRSRRQFGDRVTAAFEARIREVIAQIANAPESAPRVSEAEREYVTRAGTTTPFWWGSAISTQQANYNGLATPYAGGGSKGEYRRRTVPVDSFQPNPWGLYQVHGNVWEWTEDCWNGSYSGAPTDGSAWTRGYCSGRVIRGGSWDLNPGDLRSALRLFINPTNRSYSLGFRVARTLVTP